MPVGPSGELGPHQSTRPWSALACTARGHGHLANHSPAPFRGHIWLALGYGLLGLAVSFAPLMARGATLDGRPAVGAYCPLPEPGQKPACLSPAKSEYSDFFAAVEDGHIAQADADAVEGDLSEGGRNERAYWALSSISYGYWRLATRLAQAPDADPALLERLSHWNDLLLATYGESQSDLLFRDAVRTAALDLQTRTPHGPKRCEAGQTCEPADSLVAALTAFDLNAGLRSPIEQLIQRFRSGSEDSEAITVPVSDRP